MKHDKLALWSEKIPLAAAMLAQCFVVARWYIGAHAPAPVPDILIWINVIVGIAAGAALDLVVVSTVMARRDGRRSVWGIATAGAAALGSALIALDLYGGWTLGPYLHTVYPLVVFLFSMHLSSPRNGVRAIGVHRTLIRRLVRTVREGRADVAQQGAIIAQLQGQVAHSERRAVQLEANSGADVAHLQAQLAQTEDRAVRSEQDKARFAEQVAQLQQELAQQSSKSVQDGQRLAQTTEQQQRDIARIKQELAQATQKQREANDRIAQAERESERLRQQLAQRSAELEATVSSEDIDRTAIAQRLKDAGASWREIETLVGISQSTLRSRLKARTNGHLQEAI